MRPVFCAALLVLLSVTGAAAQQASCRSTYRLGEPIPPACQDRLRTGLPAYMRWGEGYGATATVPQQPTVSSTRPEWRYFGGHNAAYGFGR